MDQNALNFIDSRQAVLRDAYNAYKLQFPSVFRDLRTKRWAWGHWNDNDIHRLVAECLDNERIVRDNSSSKESYETFYNGIVEWTHEFLKDTGSMFRLYRKSGFDTHKALVALRDTLKFRIEHRRQLLWSPIKYDTPTNSPETIKLPERKTSSSSSRRDSASSRTSAQSPRASPAPGWDPSGNPESPKRALKEDASPQGGVEESLLQLYPHSTSDPNKRPIIVVSLKHLDQERSSKDTKGNVSSSLSTPPTIQALSAFERLRCYLAESAWKEEHPPLQFILLINLSGGRVSTTAWDMVKWLVRDAADQFHGMCSAVLVVNYSWEFGAVWSFIKHVLPSSAKARVIFPKSEELVEYLGEDTLPPSLGGSKTSTLPYYQPPFVAHMDTMLSIKVITPSNVSSRQSSVSSISIRPSGPRRISLRYLHSTSHENSYYGYPATIEEGVDTQGRPVRVQHSRRRKRDLIRTLLWLLLLRLQARVTTFLWRLRNLTGKLLPTRRNFLVILAVMAVLVSFSPRSWQRYIRLRHSLRTYILQ